MTRFQQALKGVLQIVGIEKGIFVFLYDTWRYLTNHGNASDLQKSGNSDKNYTRCFYSMTRFQQALKGVFLEISTCGLLQIVDIEKCFFFHIWYMKIP